MKTIWTLLGTLMAASLFAQNNTNSLPAIPPPVSSPAAETAPASPSETTTVNTPAATPSPAPVKHKHHHVAKKSVRHEKPEKSEPSVTLAPGTAEVSANDLVVRGQAGLKGEMVTHLSKGDTVTILEQIDLAHHTADEPSQWAKISYPTNAHVWVVAKYIDASGAVTIKKLNLRAGPGENYSVVGVIDQGTQVTKEGTKGSWLKIDPPANAYAFVAAKYLTQEASQQVASTAPAETAEGTSGMSSSSPEANAPGGPQIAPTTTTVPEQQQIVTTPPPATEAQAPATPTVRIVQHQGVIGPVGSIIAPTTYKLYDPATGVDIDYLYVIPGTPLDLSKLVDAQVIVTGEEGIDQRWPNTPVIAIQNIQVIGTNVIKHLDTTIPRLRH